MESVTLEKEVQRLRLNLLVEVTKLREAKDMKSIWVKEVLKRERTAARYARRVDNLMIRLAQR